MRSSAPHGSAMEIGIELSKCIHIYIYLYIHPITNLGEEWRNADCYGVTFLGRPGPGLIMQKTGSLLSSPGWSILLRCLFSHIISASKISAKKLHKQHIQHPHHHFFGCLGESPKIFGGKNIENAWSQPSLDDASHIGSIAFLWKKKNQELWEFHPKTGIQSL